MLKQRPLLSLVRLARLGNVGFLSSKFLAAATRFLDTRKPAQESTVAAIFASYFCYVGVFSPYLSLFFSSKGFSVSQIGFLIALTSAVRMFGPLAWAWWSDRIARPNLLLRLSTGLMLASLLTLPFLSSVSAFAIAIFCLFLANSAVGPISEALAIQVSQGDGGRYGRVRLWGSTGFVVGVMALGPLLDLTGVQTLPWWMIASGVVVAVIPWFFGDVPAPIKTTQPAARIVSVLQQAPVILFFISAFFMIFAHAALYTFYSLQLERLGFSKTHIGLFWSIGVLAEIALFYFQDILFKRFSLLHLLLFSFVCAVIRFVVIGFAEASAVLLIIAQLMHAVTFAVHHSASVGLIRQWFAPNQLVRAQALYIVIAYGFGGTAGGLLLAQVWERFSSAAVFFASAGAAALGAVMVILLIKQTSRGAIANQELTN